MQGPMKFDAIQQRLLENILKRVAWFVDNRLDVKLQKLDNILLHLQYHIHDSLDKGTLTPERLKQLNETIECMERKYKPTDADNYIYIRNLSLSNMNFLNLDSPEDPNEQTK